MMNAVQIAEKRQAVETRLAELRAAQGAAIVDGKDFGRQQIPALEAELEGIAAAEGELARRRRVEAAGEEAALRQQIMREYAGAEAERLAALGKAEKQARVFAESCRTIVAAGVRQREALARLRAPVPVHLIPGEILNRLSYRLSAALSGIGAIGSFGAIALQPGLHPGDRKWTDGEAAELEERTT